MHFWFDGNFNVHKLPDMFISSLHEPGARKRERGDGEYGDPL